MREHFRTENICPMAGVNDTAACKWIFLFGIACVHLPDPDGGIVAPAQKEFSSISPAKSINTATRN